MKRAAVVLVGALAISACGGSSKPSAAPATDGPTTTVKATTTTEARHFVIYTIVVQKGCDDADSGYDDIDIGAEVEVVSGTGDLLGFGTLANSSNVIEGLSCEYSSQFPVRKSPDGFYRITSGNENRGYLNRSESDFNTSGVLTVGATLG